MDFWGQYRNDMMDFVKDKINRAGTAGNPRKETIGYSRYEHTLRVFKWMEVLYEAYPEKEKIDLEMLRIGTLFHDVGYSCAPDGDHATPGKEITYKYLISIDYPEDRARFVADLVGMHSDKLLMKGEISPELLILMEADLLDDTGAQELVMDTWMEVANNKDVTFNAILDHMVAFTIRHSKKPNPMVTDKGKEIWDAKYKLAVEFVRQYAEDIRTP